LYLCIIEIKIITLTPKTRKGTKIMTTTRKSVKMVVEDNGCKYIHIYEVICKKHDGEKLVYGHYLSEKEAEETAKFVEEKMADLYQFAWSHPQIVWC